jgi:hypothetical protein
MWRYMRLLGRGRSVSAIARHTGRDSNDPLVILHMLFPKASRTGSPPRSNSLPRSRHQRVPLWVHSRTQPLHQHALIRIRPIIGTPGFQDPTYRRVRQDDRRTALVRDAANLGTAHPS